MRRVRRLVLAASIVVAAGLGPMQAEAYCDPKFDGCTNSCKETAKLLERTKISDLFVCPQ